jgi:hypothetical protein
MLFSEMIAGGCEKEISYLLFSHEAHKRVGTARKNAKIPAAVQMLRYHLLKG